MKENVLRIGIGGPVGSGKTALTEALVPRLLATGRQPAVITNDIDTRYLRTNAAVTESDAIPVRDGKPVILTNSLTSEGVDELQDLLLGSWAVRPRALTR
ncbi:hypothetical protein LRP67_05990 [Nocardioides sp. cx-169]|uniref:GTP-binding protein n=1 Tax=Nocardioides sp. cx-169 TaxID=2899080 RepID=UPI001E3E0243|nr:GTP-binding protein [Nocardioides sp. cx-169]MCD4533628.1 hypothetical protein [Nocardioides sp. cx-169]